MESLPSYLKETAKKAVQDQAEEGIVIVHGTGRRKTHLQKSIETLETYISKLKEYRKNPMYVENAIVIPKQTRMQPLCE